MLLFWTLLNFTALTKVIQTLFKMSYFVFHKFIVVWNDMRVNK